MYLFQMAYYAQVMKKFDGNSADIQLAAVGGGNDDRLQPSVGSPSSANSSMISITVHDHVGDDTLQTNFAYVWCMKLQQTKPGTPEREFVYRRTVWVHLVCVHIFGNILTLYVILSTRTLTDHV